MDSTALGRTSSLAADPRTGRTTSIAQEFRSATRSVGRSKIADGLHTARTTWDHANAISGTAAPICWRSRHPPAPMQTATRVAATLPAFDAPAPHEPGRRLSEILLDRYSGIPATLARSIFSTSPTASIRASVRPDLLTCLDCGFKSKMLERHISAAQGVTVDEYRTRWNLPSD
jgi:hypothetical protein